ncbi:MAG: aminoacyl-tRNA hydrolase [Rhodobacteraceae bacterium]|nr:aminoacyl-tRNA hydrolase [Paracoccaceae bacterium]
MPLRVSPTITLEDEDLVERFVRASGPGGQNVNKVSTAVELRFDVARSEALTQRVKRRLAQLAGRRMTLEGVLVLHVDDHRTQPRNRDLARERLVELIREAAAPPPPPRIATKPTLGSKKRRLDAKTRRGDVKRLRKPNRLDD